MYRYREFYKHDETAQRVGDAETLRQLLLKERLPAYVRLAGYSARSMGEKPVPGETLFAKWSERRAHHRRRLPPNLASSNLGSRDRRFLLEGWFRLASCEVRTLALRGELDVAVLTPPADIEGDATNDVYDAAVLFEADLKVSIRALWFRPEHLRYLDETARVDKAFDPRERTSMLRIIRALKLMAISKERGAAVAIEAKLAELGFESPKENAIRKFLDEALALEQEKRNSG